MVKTARVAFKKMDQMDRIEEKDEKNCENTVF
jgi:hypothetical protein